MSCPMVYWVGKCFFFHHYNKKIDRARPRKFSKWTALYLMEKTEENGHLEWVYGNISFGKVVQNDLICYPGCLETPSGHSSVVIDRDPPFLTAKMGLLRQVMQTKVVSNHYWDSMTPSRYSSIFRQQGRIGWVILFKINWITGKNTKMISVSQQSNPWELSLVTGRATLYSASPV